MPRSQEEVTVTIREITDNVDGARRLLAENAALLESIAKFYRETAKSLDATL